MVSWKRFLEWCQRPEMMKTYQVNPTAVFVVFSLIAASAFTTVMWRNAATQAALSSSETIERLTAELEQMQSKTSAAQSTIDQLRGQLEDMQSQYESSQDTIDQLSDEMEYLQGEYGSSQMSMEQLSTQNTILAKENEALQEQISELQSELDALHTEERLDELIEMYNPSTPILVVPSYYGSIQEAIDNAAPGGIVFVSSGTYHETLIIDKALKLIGEDKKTTILDCEGRTGNGIYITADDVSVQGFTIRDLQDETGDTGFSAGIHLDSVKGCRISDNRIFFVSSNPGIFLNLSSSCTIESNTMTSNGWGIIMIDVTYVEIKYNEILGNFIGLFMGSSRENEVSWNKLYTQDAEAIRMLGCEDNTISSNDLRNNFRGMYMISSSFNLITSNNFTNCGLSGIDFNRCSHDNHVYHNNFVTDRTEPDFEGYAIADDDELDKNHWDDGYPSGGNYWDDYTGVDLYGGENQDVPGSDGIGDTPYPVLIWDEISREFFFAEYNVDRYPLTDPWSPEDG